MPLLHRKPFVKNRLPINLKNEEEIFHCTITNEIFRVYDDFFDRLILCNSLVWTCSITGKPGLTYQEAQESEAKGRKTLSNFPEHLPKVLLFLATLTKRTRLYDINDDVYSFMSCHYFIQELVEASYKSTKQTCRVISIISPEDVVDGEYKRDYEPSHYKYMVQDIKTKKELLLSADKISRKKGSYTRDKSRIFLKSHCEVNKFGQWIVKARYMNKFALKNFVFTDFFPCKSPKFESSEKRIDSIFLKVTTENAHLKAMHSKITKTKQEENASSNNVLVDRSHARERLKQEKIEEKKKAKEEKILELKKIREEKLQKEVDLRLYMRPREDLHCDDLKPMPLSNELDIADGVTPEIFSDTLSIVEFMHSFHELFDLHDTFPGGIKFGELLDAVVDDSSQKSRGLLTETVNFLLQTLFSFMEGEKQDIGSKSVNSAGNSVVANSVNPDDEEGSENTIAHILEHATKADNWSRQIYGIPVQDIPMDAISVSEILRLHLESSGKHPIANQIRYYYQQRGAYTPQDNPAIQLKLETDLVSRLAIESLYDFNATDKLRLLSTLTGQLMTYILTRDCIEDSQEKLKQFRAEQRLHIWLLARRDRDESSFWWHKKMEERSKNKLESKKTDPQKKLTDMPNIVVVNDSKEKTAPVQDDLDAKPKEEVTAPQELVKFVVPMSRQSNRLEVGVKEGGGGGKNAETPLIDKDPMVNCPTENIDWAALTPDERQRISLFNEQRSEYLSNRISSLIQNTVSLKLGRDRCYRQYYFFRGLPGIYIEEVTEHGIEIALADLIPQKTIEKTIANTSIADSIKHGDSEGNVKNSSDKENESFDACELLENSSTGTQTVQEMIEMNGSHVWTCLDTVKQIDNLIDCLSPRGHREIALKASINENKSMLIESIKFHNKKSMFCKIVKSKTKLSINSSIRTELIWSLFDIEERIYSGSLGSLKNVVRADWLQKLTDLENNTEDDIEAIVKQLICVIFEIQSAVDSKYVGQPIGSAVENNRRKRSAPNIEKMEVLVEHSRKNMERWKNSVSESSSYSQLYILLGTLDKSILWARSILEAHCRICRRKNDADKMLLCDGCNYGHHMYCLKPVMKKVPEGDWFCTDCRPKQKINTPRKRNRSVAVESDDEIENKSESSIEDRKTSKKSKARRKVFIEEAIPEVDSENETGEDSEKKSKRCVGRPRKNKLEEELEVVTKKGRKRKIVNESSDDEISPKKFKGHTGRTTKLVDYTEQKVNLTESETDSPKKKGRRSGRSGCGDSPSPTRSHRSEPIVNGKRKSRDMSILNECSDIIKSLMTNDHSWPFLKPISKKIAPDYNDVIKKKMDFSTIMSKTNQGQYFSDPLVVIDDAKLIFSNCKEYNEESTDEFKAAHELSKSLDKLITSNAIIKEALKFRVTI